jgi:hypothetical protein
MSGRDAYVQAVLALYRRLSGTATRPRLADRQLAAELHRRGIPLDVIEIALRLAAARRFARPADALPLPAVRSLHYFLPVIDELPPGPPPEGYLDYLRDLVPDNTVTTPPPPRPSSRRTRQLQLPLGAVQKKTFPDDR